MIIKDVKTREELRKVISELKPFGSRKVILLSSKAYATPELRRGGRVIIIDAYTGELLDRGESNYHLIDKYKSGWKYSEKNRGFGVKQENGLKNFRASVMELILDRLYDAYKEIIELYDGAIPEVEMVENPFGVKIKINGEIYTKKKKY